MATTTSSVESSPAESPNPAWHTLTVAEALRQQGVDAATGLSTTEAEARLKKYGPNAFTAEKK